MNLTIFLHLVAGLCWAATLIIAFIVGQAYEEVIRENRGKQ